ncbi:hypothetical protein ACS127_17300 [Amphibacillus sp. Q70]|uniref:hypothetical protein n=1 Tax=Amphibacillus sp. Q70 TaxID=3453416 RepID=UPI003F85B8B2
MAKLCAICGSETGLDRNSIANKEVACRSCINQAKLTALEVLKLRKMTADDLKEKINNVSENKDDPANFNTTKKIGSHVAFDDHKKKWGIPSALGLVLPQNFYDYNDVVAIELLEDGQTQVKGGIGRALVGGALAGGAGAIVGAVTRKSKDVCNSLKVKVTTRDINKPAVFITFLDKKTKKDSSAYKKAYQQAQECLSAFQVICDRNN